MNLIFEKNRSSYLLGDMTSKQNLLSESLVGRTVHIFKSPSITVGNSSLSLLLKIQFILLKNCDSRKKKI